MISVAGIRWWRLVPRGVVAASLCLVVAGAPALGQNPAQNPAPTSPRTTAPLKGQALTGAEIRATLLGNTTYGRAISGERWAMWIQPDGKLTVRGTTTDGSIFGDTGQGTVEGDRWCVVWELLRLGERLCQTVVKDGDQFRNVAPDGHVASTYVVRPGNPEGL
jgi:hypothetical protein